MFSIAVVLVAVVITVLAWLYKRYWDDLYLFWEKKGVPHVPGRYPHGLSEEFSKGTVFPGYLVDKYYRQFSEEPYFGVYRDFNNTLILRDPEIIKLVLAKEFSHFRDRMTFKIDKSDILAQHLFMLNGDKWRALRVRMSPAFTSGKLKAMFPLFVKCAEAFEELLESLDWTDMDAKAITRRFSTEVICCCAFGLEVGTIKDTDSPFAKLASSHLHRTNYLFLALMLIKKYFPFLEIHPKRRIHTKESEDFMMKTINDTVEHRIRTGQKRNDFIDLLIQLKEKGILNEEMGEEELKEKNIEPIAMTPEVMAAQCYVFFAAGHETSSSVKSFCLYELALHLDIQERLYNEISSTISKHGGITYQAVNEMEYLDMVVLETMRKYPTLFFLDRKCSSPFTMPSGHKINKGQSILIPVWSLHHDPEYFPNPEEFNPVNFTREKRESRHPYVYLPFGEGPRICIGMRFGLLQVKMGILTIVRKYKVEPCEKTQIPLKLQGMWTPTTRTEQPIVVRLKKRN